MCTLARLVSCISSSHLLLLNAKNPVPTPTLTYISRPLSPASALLCLHLSVSHVIVIIIGSICFSFLSLLHHPDSSLPPVTHFSSSLSPFRPPTPSQTLVPTHCYLQVIFRSAVLYCPGGDLQTSCGTLDEGGLRETLDWEEEREMERLACEGDDFIPPKIMVGYKTHYKTLYYLNKIKYLIAVHFSLCIHLVKV